MSDKAVVAFIFPLPEEDDHLGLQRIVGRAKTLFEDNPDVVVKLAIRNMADKLLGVLDPEKYPSVFPLDEDEENLFKDAEDVETLIFQLGGAASMCWARMDRAGVFDSDKAKRTCEHALLRLAELRRTRSNNFDLVDVGPGAFTDGDVISYKGENYYRACDTLVTGGIDREASFCVKRIGHPGNVHEDYDGNTKEDDGAT